MRERVLNATTLAVALGLIFWSLVLESQQRPSATHEETAVRTLISQWFDAYQHADAKRLATLEAPNVEIVDRFGILHLMADRAENERLWAESFEMLSPNGAPPTVKVDDVRFLRSDVAIVQVSCEFKEGILLADGDRIPPFSEIDTFMLTKSDGIWLIAAHNMQELKTLR